VLTPPDAQGRTRLIARVSAEGTLTLQILDEQGLTTPHLVSSYVGGTNARRATRHR